MKNSVAYINFNLFILANSVGFLKSQSWKNTRNRSLLGDYRDLCTELFFKGLMLLAQSIMEGRGMRGYVFCKARESLQILWERPCPERGTEVSTVCKGHGILLIPLRQHCSSRSPPPALPFLLSWSASIRESAYIPFQQEHRLGTLPLLSEYPPALSETHLQSLTGFPE